MKQIKLFLIILILFLLIIPSVGMVTGQTLLFEELDDSPFFIYLPLIGNNSSEIQINKTVSLNDVNITVESPVLPESLSSTDSDNFIQVASAFKLDPFEEFSINSIPYNTSSPIEQLSIALPGGAPIYRDELEQYRISQGGIPTTGPNALLFDQTITSSYSIVTLNFDPDHVDSTLIVEWVVDAFEKLWIFRVSHDITDGTDINTYLNNLNSLVVDGDQLAVGDQSNVLPSVDNTISPDLLTDSKSLPFPSWWDGQVCDYDDYYEASGLYPKQLGSPYDGLIACGPRGTLIKTYYFVGDTVGAYEWQCVELAKRYIYLKYGIEPFGSYGGKYFAKEFYNHTEDSSFELIKNGTVSKPPKQGDVISFYSSSIFGHVAIVTASDINAYGNGNIEIIAQNDSSTGRRIIEVNKWKVGSLAINWVHKKPTSSGMVLIPEGKFSMGCDPNHNAGIACWDWELPLHSVYLDDYFIDKYEVTNAGYKQCVQAGVCSPPPYIGSSTRDDYYINPAFSIYPVIFVTIDNARSYCQWLGKRLPTEAEWEKAARGPVIITYPWGDTPPSCSIVNYNDCVGDTTAVGTYPEGKSYYGVMDMAGNVWEYVNDLFSPTYYSISPYFNPTGPTTGTQNITRGGDFHYGSPPLKPSFRLATDFGTRYSDVGFRCVKDLP